MEYAIAILGISAGLGVFFYRAYIAPLVAENHLKRHYQSLAEPLPIFQHGEGDKGFYARVQTEKARFEQSGNNIAKTQIPVIAFPYDSNFTIGWFGKEYDYSTIGMRTREYHVECFRIYNELYAIWQQKTSAFGDETMAYATGQKHFDSAKIWN